MGTITIAVDAGVSGQNSKIYTVTNANLGRLVAWSKANLFKSNETPTNAEALDAWAEMVMRETKNNVLGWEQRNTAPPTFDYS